jgi:hypothetical protein
MFGRGVFVKGKDFHSIVMVVSLHVHNLIQFSKG